VDDQQLRAPPEPHSGGDPAGAAGGARASGARGIVGTRVEGELKDLPSTPTAWLEEVRRNVELDARSYEVYLHRRGLTELRFALLAIYVGSPGAVIGWALWLRAYARRRRARAATARR